MIYTCGRCGRRYTRDFEECPNCGGYVYIDDEGTSRKRGKAQRNQGSSIGMNIISFFLPVLGFIFYGIHIKSSPGIAKGCLKSAIVSTSLIFLMYMGLFAGMILFPNTMGVLFDGGISSNYQYLNNGDIVIKSVDAYSVYSDEENRVIWYYTVKGTAKEKCSVTFYLHMFNDYKESLGNMEVEDRIYGAGDFTLTGRLWSESRSLWSSTGYNPEGVYYISLSEYEHYYDPDYMYKVD